MSGWEQHGPFKRYTVTVNGWSVPLLEAHELDGGKVSIVCNGYHGYVASIAEADALIPFLANVVASALGYRYHPRSGESIERRMELLALVPHESLAPQRVGVIEGAAVGDQT
jgi:hypothetical protein